MKATLRTIALAFSRLALLGGAAALGMYAPQVAPAEAPGATTGPQYLHTTAGAVGSWRSRPSGKELRPAPAGS